MSILSFEDIKTKKNEISQIIDDVLIVRNGLENIGLAIEPKVLQELKKKLVSDNFKVLVIGEFKSGKSTVINALLGEKILPVYATPCTAVISEVVYGKEKKAMIHFKNPRPKEMSTEINTIAARHIEKYKNNQFIPPYEIDVEELDDYVAIPDPSKNQEDSIREIPYSKVVLEYPLPFCRDGIEIIDSPGLNENGTRTKVTNEYLNEADAIVFVFRCPKIGRVTEINFINNKIKAMGHEAIFFVCNCINLVPEDERNDLKKYGNNKLVSLTSLGEKGIFYVDALKALKAKRIHDDYMLTESEMPRFQEVLFEYLRNNRGKIKLTSIVDNCIAYIDKSCIEQMNSYISYLNQDVAMVEQKLQLEIPKLLPLEEQKENVGQTINLETEKLKKIFIEKLEVKYTDIISEIPDFVDKLDIQFTVNQLKGIEQKKQKTKLEREVLEKVNEFIENEMSEWFKTEGDKCLQEFYAEVQIKLQKKINDFYDSLDDFRYTVSGINRTEGISGWDRMVKAISGTIVGGAVLGSLVANLGWSTLMSLYPFGLIVMVFCLGLRTIYPGATYLEKKYKEKMASNIVKKMREDKTKSIDEYAKKIAGTVLEKMLVIPQALQQEIDFQKATIAAIRKEKENSSKARAEKIEILQKLKVKLEENKSKLEKLKETFA